MVHNIILYADEFPVGPQDLRPVDDQYGTGEDIDIDFIDFFITGNICIDLAAQFGIANEFFTVQADTAWQVRRNGDGSHDKVPFRCWNEHTSSPSWRFPLKKRGCPTKTASFF